MIIEVKDVTEKSKFDQNSSATLFPDVFGDFYKHDPGGIYEGCENVGILFVFEVLYRDAPGFHDMKKCLEVWGKGGDWNEHYFIYFVIGTAFCCGKLYSIPQFSPKCCNGSSHGFDCDDCEVVEIELTSENLKEFIEKKFLGGAIGIFDDVSKDFADKCVG